MFAVVQSLWMTGSESTLVGYTYDPFIPTTNALGSQKSFAVSFIVTFAFPFVWINHTRFSLETNGISWSVVSYHTMNVTKYSAKLQ